MEDFIMQVNISMLLNQNSLYWMIVKYNRYKSYKDTFKRRQEKLSLIAVLDIRHNWFNFMKRWWMILDTAILQIC